MALPIHKHLLIRAEIKNPPGADDVEATKDWVRNLIETIGMKLLAGPFCEYVHVEGNAGITAVSITCHGLSTPSQHLASCLQVQLLVRLIGS